MRALRDKDLRALAGLACLAALLMAPRLAGRTFFWGDLAYLHHPWRALQADQVLRGALPLWNPYAYLGMPLAASMQGGAWYPGTLPFYLFGFEAALPLFHLLHYGLTGALTFLWLRRLGLSRGAAFAGGCAAMLWGGMASRIPFLNHASTLCYLPAFLLFAPRVGLLALSLALSYLSGYAPMVPGAAAAAWAVGGALGGRWLNHTWAWVRAGALSLALCACLLLPASRLAADSRRGGGIPPEEALEWSFAPRDLVQLTAPPLVPRGEYSPSGLWWKTAYWGVSTLAAAGAGLARLPPGRAAAAAAYLAGVLLVLLGGSTGPSRALWTQFPPLAYVRYPGNMAYLLLPLVPFLAAKGLDRRRGAWLAAFLVAGELATYAARGHPLARSGYFTEAGPLVRALRSELLGHRYLISPKALQWQRGAGPDPESAGRDLRHRLYGLMNLPYRLDSAANFGEPLVPRRNYDLMDFLYRRSGPAELGPWLGWADVRVLLTLERMAAPGFTYLGDSLWQLYRFDGAASRALWFPEGAGGRIPEDITPPPVSPASARLASFRRAREDSLEAWGDSDEPGWLFLSEPAGLGWQAEVNGLPGRLSGALGPFAKLRVPAGAWRVRLRYLPWEWRLGRALTLLAIGSLAAFWYDRLRLRGDGKH